ncbi:MAG: HD domain-containing protein [Lachnospiraceae bacterium]|nr:HD domain-containing protein [Lachnospiraceae bacterium]
MSRSDYNTGIYKRTKIYSTIILCIIGIGINIGGGALATHFGWPFYFDTVGTVISAGLGGYIPGVLVGLLTNFIKSIYDNSAIYYGFLNVLIAVCTAYFVQKGYPYKISTTLIFTFVLSVIGGILGSVFTWVLYGFAGEGISVPFVKYLYNNGTFTRLQAQFLADYLIDLADKIITVLIVLVIILILPDKLKKKLMFDGWHQAPLSKEQKKAISENKCRSMSLRTKVLLVLMTASFFIATAYTIISFVLYRNSTINDHIKLGKGVAYLAASTVDADMVDAYMKNGEEEDGYLETEKRLYDIRNSSYDIEYVYVYKIMEDGCHVVFDLDTDELEGSAPGEIIEFDDAFMDYLPDLLAGKEIEPIISNDKYGWLLTVYQPVYDEDGICQCYAAIDISMDQLRQDQYSFFAKLISIFLGFFITILTIGLWLAEYNVIKPLNAMALSASSFAYNSDEARNNSVDKIKELDIRTGDEIENLYLALVKTTEDSMQYVSDIKEHTETISNMQNGLIMVLADLVESRDKCTGDHVKKTAAYASLIMRQMKKEGIYADELTDEFIYDVEHSAPLHDIGKIKVSDVILNKPGRLTDEEFEEMKKHTTAGEEIIEKAMEIVPDTGYLKEAKNLSTYHHEKWDGSGYPKGLVGEDIPLSARIMAVADVFDALVSNRSYKKGFPFEKAMDIIKEGMGSHFDPLVAKAFVDAEDEVRRIAEEHSRIYENDNKEDSKDKK